MWELGKAKPGSIVETGFSGARALSVLFSVELISPRDFAGLNDRVN